MLLGIHLTLLIGPTVPLPAPSALAEALVGVEVTHGDEGRSGFQLTFQVGRSGLADLADFPLLANPLLRPFTRVVLLVILNATPRILMDGFVTRHQLSPNNEPGASTLTVTGEDVSVKMDLVEKKVPHPGQNEAAIAASILAQYPAILGQPPVIVPPLPPEVPAPTERIPNQGGKTDLAYLNELASRFGYVFYVTPGPLPGQNRAYWGPPTRLGLPQSALSVNMGPSSNVEQISFQYDALAPTMVIDVIQDSETNVSMPVIAVTGSRPPLAAMPATLTNLPNVRIATLGQQNAPAGDDQPNERGGMSFAHATTLAQAKVDAAADKVVTATGELDALRYGDILTPRGLVGVRGAGYTNDGHYYVKNVTHAIGLGSYRQRFTLAREGIGALTPVVRP